MASVFYVARCTSVSVAAGKEASGRRALRPWCCFTDPVSGQRHGYYDGWDDEGLYNFVGEGQTGDQTLTQRNRTILDHVAEGRSLEGFLADSTSVSYLGEFVLIDYYFTEAHESGNLSLLRQVVVFRLRPVAGSVPVELPHVPITPEAAARIDTPKGRSSPRIGSPMRWSAGRATLCAAIAVTCCARAIKSAASGWSRRVSLLRCIATSGTRPLRT